MTIFIAGGTGYMGQSLIPILLAQGHCVRALVRPGSAMKLPAGCQPVTGDALDSASFRDQVSGADAWVHLIGVPRPNPSKAAEFRTVDLASVQAAAQAAQAGGIAHFVYVSVAQPAPVMKAYVAVRAECENAIRAAGLNATFVRPWYVLGPGHWWPLALLPFYKLAEIVPFTRETARRLGLVTLSQMTAALAWAVNHPCQGIRILSVHEIRTCPETM
jgi:uncharacterized protein YbjT (DUF2867 family)